jgi:hypothetical protein
VAELSPPPAPPEAVWLPLCAPPEPPLPAAPPAPPLPAVPEIAVPAAPFPPLPPVGAMTTVATLELHWDSATDCDDVFVPPLADPVCVPVELPPVPVCDGSEVCVLGLLLSFV